MPARHVEIQVLCDGHGGVLTLGERECSIQRRHQKLIEESPSVGPDARDPRGDGGVGRARLPAARIRQRRHVRVPPRAGRVSSFIEVNCRLQVEHPVTEMVTGIDIVREQLRIAAGERLADHGPRPTVGARDRDPDQRRGSTRGTSLPRPGLVTRFRPPLGPGVRVDTAVVEGAAIPPFYDSMIAKVIVRDDTRAAAIARAIRALEELEIEGIPTTRELAIDVLRSREFRGGDYSTSYLAEMEGRLPSMVPA